jgi:hypothetical protein
MPINGIIFGQNVRFNTSGTRVTQALRDALVILDEECRGGSGGTFDIHRIGLNGRKVVAIPVDGPFDTLYYNPRKGKWTI